MRRRPPFPARGPGALLVSAALLIGGCFTSPTRPVGPPDPDESPAITDAPRPASPRPEEHIPPLPATNNLTPAQREEIFMAIWNTAKENFPAFELKQIDWVKVRDKYLEQLREPQSDQTFELLLKQTVAELKDTHAYLDFPMDERRQPAVRTLMDGDRVIITAITPGSDAEKAGLRAGMELLRVDGKPVTERWAAHAATLSESTPYRLRWNSARTILFGLPDTSVAVAAKGSDGQEVVAVLQRNEMPRSSGPFFESRTLENGAVYLQILTFDDDEVHQQTMAALLEAIAAKPPALIIDVRGNGGGDYRPGAALAGHLVDKAGQWGYVKLKSGQLRPIDVVPADPYYSGPVILLTNPGCISACDAFATYFKRTGRGIVVGEPTAGATYESADYDLPHGYHLHMPGGRQLVGPDAEIIETRPVQPDHLVVPTAADFAAGRDPALEKALSLIK